jgi:hypothetical protein
LRSQVADKDLQWIRQYEEVMGFDFNAFSPQELFDRIKGRTLWFMGDSQVGLGFRVHGGLSGGPETFGSWTASTGSALADIVSQSEHKLVRAAPSS